MANFDMKKEHEEQPPTPSFMPTVEQALVDRAQVGQALVSRNQFLCNELTHNFTHRLTFHKFIISLLVII